MAVVSFTALVPGSIENVADLNTILTAFATQVNGNLDSNNLAASAVVETKIASSAVSTSKFATLPQLRAYHNANQAITSGVVTALAFNSERWDSGTPSSNMHDTAVNNSRGTCQVAGLYLIQSAISWQSNATGERFMNFVLNGTTEIARDRRPVSATATTSEVTLSTVYRLALADYVEVTVEQTSGGSLNVNSLGNYSPEFTMTWLGP